MGHFLRRGGLCWRWTKFSCLSSKSFDRITCHIEVHIFVTCSFIHREFFLQTLSKKENPLYTKYVNANISVLYTCIIKSCTMYVYTCIRIIIVKLLHVSWNFVLVRWKVFNLFLHCFTGWPLNKFCHYKFTVKCYNTLATNFRDILYLQVMEKDISPVCCFLISSGQMSSQFPKEQFVGTDYWTKDLLF